jgi:hypothetical protein
VAFRGSGARRDPPPQCTDCGLSTAASPRGVFPSCCSVRRPPRPMRSSFLPRAARGRQDVASKTRRRHPRAPSIGQPQRKTEMGAALAGGPSIRRRVAAFDSRPGKWIGRRAAMAGLAAATSSEPPPPNFRYLMMIITHGSTHEAIEDDGADLRRRARRVRLARLGAARRGAPHSGRAARGLRRWKKECASRHAKGRRGATRNHGKRSESRIIARGIFWQKAKVAAHPSNTVVLRVSVGVFSAYTSLVPLVGPSSCVCNRLLRAHGVVSPHICRPRAERPGRRAGQRPTQSVAEASVRPDPHAIFYRLPPFHISRSRAAVWKPCRAASRPVCARRESLPPRRAPSGAPRSGAARRSLLRGASKDQGGDDPGSGRAGGLLARRRRHRPRAGGSSWRESSRRRGVSRFCARAAIPNVRSPFI